MFEFTQLGITKEISYAIMLVFTLMLLDIVSGLIAACKNKTLESTKMREGLFHKSAIILVLILAWVCEFFVFKVPELGISVPILIPACAIIFTMELISILENLAKINPDLANTKLLDLFKVSGNKRRKDDEKTSEIRR